jgi:hypothetical protein
VIAFSSLLDALDGVGSRAYSCKMSRGASTIIDKITQQVREGLEERFSSYAEQGQSLEGIGQPEDVARRMLATIPAPFRWDDLLGPFYSGAQIAELLGGISRQAVADRRERRTLLGLKTTDGTVVYPTFQLDDRNKALPGLPEVLQCFRGSGADDWMLAGWLVSPLAVLNERSIIQAIRDGEDLKLLLALARDAARRFSQ